MEITHLQVNGSILKEVGEKIPDVVVALNELIKNAYDAEATEVEIFLNENNKKLIIQDNGIGMDRSTIDALLQVGQSKKNYGTLNPHTNRYIQGSKGLGFLSVCKFGKNVTWETKAKENPGYCISINFNKLYSVKNISDEDIIINEKDSIPYGTKITINLNDYEAQRLSQHFSNEKDRYKILYSFYDNDFTIKLNINGTRYDNTSKIKLEEISPNYLLYNVKYDTVERTIKFYCKNKLLFSEKFDYDFKRYKTKININLNIYQFNLSSPKGNKKLIPKLFYNDIDNLTPLIYFYNNFFKNYQLFNPEILSNTQTALVLRQIIGFINIIPDPKFIDFNSDRTNLLDNEYTQILTNFLLEINKCIQIKGSNFKKNNLDILNSKNKFTIFDKQKVINNTIDANKFKIDTIEDFRQFISDDIKIKNLFDIKYDRNVVSYSLFKYCTTLNVVGSIQLKKSETASPKDTSKNPGSASTSSKDTFKNPGSASTSPKDTSKNPGSASTSSKDTFKNPGSASTSSKDTSKNPGSASTSPKDTSKNPGSASTSPKDTSKNPGSASTSSKNTSKNPGSASTSSKDTSKKLYNPAEIILTDQENITIQIPSKQIDLLNYISKATNSMGEEIDKKDILIFVNDNLMSTNILPSITEECRKKIQFAYNDPNTSNVTSTILYIDFVLSLKELKTKSLQKSTIVLPTNKTYTLQHFPIVSKLIEQINSLSRDDYQEIIACSLRAIFDIGLEEIKQSNKLSFSGDNFVNNIYTIFDTVINKETKNYFSKIATQTGMSFNTIRNTVDFSSLKEILNKAHVGAHRSTSYLTNDDIIKLGILAGIYIVFVQELLYNPDIK